jgi:hypothetical protein
LMTIPFTKELERCHKGHRIHGLPASRTTTMPSMRQLPTRLFRSLPKAD